MADHVPLPGSERPAATGARRLRDADASERVDVTVTLAGSALPEPGAGQPLTRAQLERDHGADPAAVARVTEELRGLGLRVEQSSPLTRSLRVSGTIAQLEAAFKPALGVYGHPEQGEFRGREGQLQVPAALDGLITGVFGLDQRRVARRRRAAASPGHGPDAGSLFPRQGEKGFLDAVQSANPPLAPAELAAHYSFPPGDGSEQRVAIAEFGGGFFASDLQAFCAKQGTPVPKVTTVGVNGTPVLTLAQIRQLPQQQQQQQLDDSVEVNMDVQIVAGLAPGAEQVVYFSSFDEQGWVDLIDQVVAGRPAAVATLSVSWGLAEDDPNWSQAALQAIDQRLQAAAALGITVCVAAGDDGSADQETDGRAHIDFPASSPHVLAVGGTMLSGSSDVVWWQSPGERSGGGGATGGGVSVVFPRPSWQNVQIASINPGSIDGRVIPDVAALAGPPFYDVIFIGQDQPNGGTSAATPLWAALIARMAGAVQTPWRPRYLAPLLYAPAGSAAQPVGALGCTDVTSGDNTSSTLGRGYSAGPGFDAVSGWGVPNGVALLRALGA
ncbi:MAG: S8/S53 family peptidase [Acidobacteriota bacterium]|nr:S8/S53 family peptidase [Acidobacteriota bacterium]